MTGLREAFLLVPQMEEEQTVTINFPAESDSYQVRCIYNTNGEIALVSDGQAVVTLSPLSACRLAKMLRHSSEDALSDLTEALGDA